MSNASSAEFRLYEAPGHLIRRAQQIAVSLFMEDTAEFGVTPIQFALLEMLCEYPGLDQVTLASRVALDPSTSGSTIGRLESKGLIARENDSGDRRRKLLVLTAAGRDLLDAMRDSVICAQRRILEPLDPSERQHFLTLLTKLVRLNNSRSRAPLVAHTADMSVPS